MLNMKSGVLKAAACCAVAGLAGIASAQPDVIVGECYDIQNYGLAGSVRAFAVGTYSCNKAPLAAGNKAAPYNTYNNNALLWIDQASELPSGAPASDIRMHPVISQNMYRMYNGRFEQIGQAWLKHGFCALQGNQCFSCNSGGNCNSLYPGCSDPYSGGLNGSQGGLGPKSEVNPFTGFFPYPWVNNGTGSGTAFKRLQVLDSDLTQTGALYFVSSMYVQPEDALAGNGYNNQSYRRVDVDTTGTHNITTLYASPNSGPYQTQREKAGLQAWQDNDATVTIATLNVPSDGRFLIGCKVTESAGTATYEYAVQNFNCNQGATSFSIPLPSGVVPSNIGFHDVPYHSGEPYDSTDWTSTVTSSAITWTVASGSNNQLRWDTIYNFRFTCNRAPVAGTGTLTVGSGRTFSVRVPGSNPAGTGNDACAGATPVAAGSIAFDTTSATTDGPAECVTQNDQGVIGKDLWFTWTNVGTCTGTAIVRTCGSSFDTKLAVYNGSTCPSGPNTAIACNDDAGTGTGCAGSLQSEVSFTATAGATYLIRVGGYDADGNGPGVPLSGTGTLTIVAPNCAPTPPANDPCAGAIQLADGVAATGDTTLATNDGTANCGNSTTSPDVWFKYTPVTAGTVTVNTCGSAYDTVLSVYTGTCGSLTQVACNDDAGNNGPCANTLQSYLTFSGTAGTTYYLRVAGFNSARGSYSILVTGGGGGVPPTNDNCSGRAGVVAGSYPFNTNFATTDGPAGLTSCQTATQIYNDLWYNFPTPLSTSGTLTVSTCGAASFDTVVALYDTGVCANVGPATQIACSDDACGLQSSASAHVTAGHSITIRLGGFNAAARGTGTMTITFVPDPTCAADLDDDGSLANGLHPDGGVDINDLIAMLDGFANGDIRVDLDDDGVDPANPDGGVDINDLIFFLGHFNAGC